MYKLRGQRGVFELIKESTGEVVKKGTLQNVAKHLKTVSVS